MKYAHNPRRLQIKAHENYVSQRKYIVFHETLLLIDMQIFHKFRKHLKFTRYILQLPSDERRIHRAAL